MFNFGEVRENNAMVPSLDKIKRNALFLGVERKDDGSMVFKFAEPDGAKGTLEHREFVPTRMDQQTEEDYKKIVNGTVSRISHICRAFVSQEEHDAIKPANGNGSLATAPTDWKDITTQVGKLLKSKLTAGPLQCEIKVVYRENKGKWYAAFPLIPAFISTVNHPKELINNPQYDKFVIGAARPTAMPSQGGAGAQAPQNGATQGAQGGAPASSGDDDF